MEYEGRIFKSGNSLALRLPKALGLQEGARMVLREMPVGYMLEPCDPPRKTIDISGFWGKAPDASLPLREDFDERPSVIRARENAARHNSDDK